MKSFEKWVKPYRSLKITTNFDLLQFVCQTDVWKIMWLSISVQISLKGKNLCQNVFLLIITLHLIPLLTSKLVDLGLCNSVCKRLFDFLIGGPQKAKVDTRYSSIIVVNTGGTELSQVPDSTVSPCCHIL